VAETSDDRVEMQAPKSAPSWESRLISFCLPLVNLETASASERVTLPNAD